MKTFTEEQLENWYKPVSTTEDEKINHTIDMIRLCHNKWLIFDEK